MDARLLTIIVMYTYLSQDARGTEKDVYGWKPLIMFRKARYRLRLQVSLFDNTEEVETFVIAIKEKQVCRAIEKARVKGWIKTQAPTWQKILSSVAWDVSQHNDAIKAGRVCSMVVMFERDVVDMIGGWKVECCIQQGVILEMRFFMSQTNKQVNIQEVPVAI